MLTCPQCQHGNPRGSKFCEGCGASLQAVEAYERVADEAEAEVLLLEVKKARTAMAVVAVLQAVGALIYFATSGGDTTVMSIMFGIAGVFVGLWWWSKTNPFAASIVGLVVFATLHLADAVVDPSSIYRGIIVKVIVVVVLVRAISAGLKHRAFVRERGLR